LETNETFAVKKILIDPTFKSRELELLQSFTHPNVLNLKDHFFEKSQDNPIDD
jgi:serine/threonine protein kinase